MNEIDLPGRGGGPVEEAIAIHHLTLKGERRGWTFRRHGQAPHILDPAQPPDGYPTCAAATQAAITWARARGWQIAVTGHPDRQILRAAGIPYIDSRGNRRRSPAALLKTDLRRLHRLALLTQAQYQRALADLPALAARLGPGRLSPQDAPRLIAALTPCDP